jgi:hypothetical protein
VRLAFSVGETARLSGQMSIHSTYATNVVFARQAQARPSKEMTPAGRDCDAGSRLKLTGWLISGRKVQTWPLFDPRRQRKSELAARET